MSSEQLQEIAEKVVQRAKDQGSIVPKEVRAELASAGASERLWKDVLALARPSLSYRKGKYFYISPVTERVRQEQDHQRIIREMVEDLIDKHRNTPRKSERREAVRVDFVQVIKAIAEDGREFTVISRDLSTSGIRLIGTRSMLGQKITLYIPHPTSATPWCFLVRILWTCALGDDLFENGGLFVDVRG
jgi:hypothetical protein